MKEGWHKADYLVLFDAPEETQRMTELYGIAQYLPGYTIIGLRGWDDFIVQNSQGSLFTIPTVPLEPKHLSPLCSHIDVAALKADERFATKIKWYVQPLVFGGDPKAEQNTTWLPVQQHTEAVRWWNRKYHQITKQQENA